MDDPLDVLDCSLRSKYVTPETLPCLPVWERLPEELRAALADALASGKQLNKLVPLIWRVRVELYGKHEPDYTGERTRATAALRLGLLYLAHREERLDLIELLSRAFHVADRHRHMCEIDARPFTRLKHELVAGEPDGGRVAALFVPYVGSAEQCVRQWGLRRSDSARDQPEGELTSEPDPAV